MAGDGDTRERANGAQDDGADDELVQRLRDLDWPKPPPGVRERSLAELERRLSSLPAEPAPVDE